MVLNVSINQKYIYINWPNPISNWDWCVRSLCGLFHQSVGKSFHFIAKTHQNLLNKKNEKGLQMPTIFNLAVVEIVTVYKMKLFLTIKKNMRDLESSGYNWNAFLLVCVCICWYYDNQTENQSKNVMKMVGVQFEQKNPTF